MLPGRTLGDRICLAARLPEARVPDAACKTCTPSSRLAVNGCDKARPPGRYRYTQAPFGAFFFVRAGLREARPRRKKGSLEELRHYGENQHSRPWWDAGNGERSVVHCSAAGWRSSTSTRWRRQMSTSPTAASPRERSGWDAPPRGVLRKTASLLGGVPGSLSPSRSRRLPRLITPLEFSHGVPHAEHGDGKVRGTSWEADLEAPEEVDRDVCARHLWTSCTYHCPDRARGNSAHRWKLARMTRTVSETLSSTTGMIRCWRRPLRIRP